MVRPAIRQISGHEMVEVQTAKAYRPYDRLVVRATTGRTIWAVLACEPACEPADQGWTVTGIRCPPGCRIHLRRR